MSLAAAIGVSGFAIALLLGALRVWETFFLRADITASFDWVQAANGSALMWFVANVGRRQAVLKEVRFLTVADTAEQGHQWVPAISEHVYPRVLDSHDVTPLVTMVEALVGEEQTAGDLRKFLRDGAIVRCVVETIEKRGPRRWTFDVPRKPST